MFYIYFIILSIVFYFPFVFIIHPPSTWKRFVDDTFVVIESSRKEEFMDHINNLDPNIQFTTEDAKTDGSLPFLDTLIHKQADNSLSTSVYRKPTHTQTYTYNGTVTTICLPNIVSLTPSDTGPRQSVQTITC